MPLIYDRRNIIAGTQVHSLVNDNFLFCLHPLYNFPSIEFNFLTPPRVPLFSTLRREINVWDENFSKRAGASLYFFFRDDLKQWTKMFIKIHRVLSFFIASIERNSYFLHWSAPFLSLFVVRLSLTFSVFFLCIS